MDDFYFAFENKFRGSRELIKSRLEVYLPFVKPLLQIYSHGLALDLGCGRGEWLELLTENGFKPQGVDVDEGMLQPCHDLGLITHKSDAIEFLKSLPECSQCIVSGFHIAEHLPFEELKQLVIQAERVLCPGGLLILETPNPENISVATNSFYLDPTHQRPIPPGLLKFLPDYYGFARTKVLRLQESPHLHNTGNVLELISVLDGVSPDYAVVAQKKGSEKLVQLTNAAFEQDFGLTLHSLAARYQTALDKAISEAACAEQVNNHNRLKIEQLSQRVSDIERSWLWRSTWQLRSFVRLIVHPISSIKWAINQALRVTIETSQRPLARVMGFVLSKPRLALFIAKRLMQWPHLYQHLTLIAQRFGLIEKRIQHLQCTIPASEAITQNTRAVDPPAS